MPLGHSKTTWGGKKVNNFCPQKNIYLFLFFLVLVGQIWSDFGQKLGENLGNLGRIWAEIWAEFGQKFRHKSEQNLNKI